MKKILLTLSILFTSYVGTTQVLFSENFENFTLGNIFTVSPNLPPITGQGGWISPVVINQSTVNKTLITQEPNRGKVLTLTTTDLPTVQTNMTISRPNISNTFNQRTPDNDVIKFEVDYYTGEQQNDGTGYAVMQSLGLIFDENPTSAAFSSSHLFLAIYDSEDLNFRFRYNNTSGLSPYDIWVGKLPYKTWITYIVYLDYKNRKIYYEIPYINAVGSGDHSLYNINSSNLIDDYKPLRIKMYFDGAEEGSNIPLTNKYDNIKITALKEVPHHILSAKSVLAQNFNLYPNPATNMVHITNTENMLVNQIEVYDTTGKLINTQNYNNETEIQLNVEHLASGTYMLHLQTNEGTAVKKLVKK